MFSFSYSALLWIYFNFEQKATENSNQKNPTEPDPQQTNKNSDCFSFLLETFMKKRIFLIQLV